MNTWYVAGELTLNCTVSPGTALSCALNPWICPYALGEYQDDIGVPGLEFSHCTGFEPGPHASAQAMLAGSAVTMTRAGNESTTQLRRRRGLIPYSKRGALCWLSRWWVPTARDLRPQTVTPALTALSGKRR